MDMCPARVGLYTCLDYLCISGWFSKEKLQTTLGMRATCGDQRLRNSLVVCMDPSGHHHVDMDVCELWKCGWVGLHRYHPPQLWLEMQRTSQLHTKIHFFHSPTSLSHMEAQSLAGIARLACPCMCSSKQQRENLLVPSMYILMVI